MTSQLECVRFIGSQYLCLAKCFGWTVSLSTYVSFEGFSCYALRVSHAFHIFLQLVGGTWRKG